MSQQTVKNSIITRNTTIGEAVQNFPEIAPILLECGLHCVGCHVAYHETLEQGCRGHGMTDEQIGRLISDVNEFLAGKGITSKERLKSDRVVELSDDAARKIKELLQKENKQDCGLRVKVVPGGCSGFMYELTFDNKKEDGDKLLEYRDVRIFVDKDSVELIDGSRIDYVDGLQGSGFKITNPNTQAKCGCGQSFT